MHKYIIFFDWANLNILQIIFIKFYLGYLLKSICNITILTFKRTFRDLTKNQPLDHNYWYD